MEVPFPRQVWNLHLLRTRTSQHKLDSTKSQSYFLDAPWLVFFPGAAILLTSLSFNLLGEALRDALDLAERR